MPHPTDSPVVPPAFETVRVEVDGARARLTLTRPDRLNAMGATMLREIAEAASWLDRRHDVRVVVVAGEGRAFSAGADLKDLPLADAMPGSGLSWLERREIGQAGLRMADAVEQMHAVTVARIQGHAVGGGIVLVAACDLRVSADDVRFCIPEIEIGIPLAWGGIPRLVREIGPALTKELVMTCRPFSAAEAKSAGFLNRVVPAEELDRETEALVADLLRMPAVPLTVTKEHVNAVARQMSAAVTSFADGDALLGTLHAPESRDAAIEYATRKLGKDTAGTKR